MEKRSPHFRLAAVKWLLQSGQVRTTLTALRDARALGLDEVEMFAVVEALTPKDFHKSMTTYADHRCWQDVYRPMTELGRICMKLTVAEGLLVVSFKEA
jgi:motility quorum-sensing regulator/GCU-specific mRNA interferase toxin